MIVEPDFLTHWKTQMVIAELNDPCGPLYVIALWAHCQQRRTASFTLPANALKAICRYPGDAETLKAALLSSGFITATEGGGFEVHEWAERNAKLFANWENGSKGGRPPKKPTGNPPETQLNPRQTHEKPIREEESRVEKTRVEKIREEREKCIGVAECITASRADVLTKWKEWIDYRMKGKKPASKDWQQFFRKQAEWLTPYPPETIIEILNQSLRNGYTGLFEPKSNGATKRTIADRERDRTGFEAARTPVKLL